MNGKVVIVRAFKTEGSRIDPARVESGPICCCKLLCYKLMILPNNRLTLGSNKTGVWIIPYQIVQKYLMAWIRQKSRKY
jgi:hypothetical protein